MAVNNPTATTATVAASATAVTLFAAQDGGIAFRTIFNDSTANLYVKFGSAATTSSFTVKIPPGGYFESPAAGGNSYDGLVTGIWDSATGNARTTEVA